MVLDTAIVIRPTYHLVKVEDAKLVDGENIEGVFGEHVIEVKNPVELCEWIVNCRLDSDILRFTKKYGPLTWRDWAPNENFRGGLGGRPIRMKFRFSLADWRQYQEMARMTWKVFSGPQPDKKANNVLSVSRDDVFELSGAGNKFVFASLLSLAEFFLATLPRDTRRVCARPDCGNLFLAKQRKQIYCDRRNPKCSHWGEVQSKKRYWDENKEKFLARRRELRRQQKGAPYAKRTTR